MHVWRMAATGLAVSVLVPGLVHATRRSALWRRLALPWGICFPGFVLLHGAAVLTHIRPAAVPAPVWAEVAVVGAAVWFWLPVLGVRHRLTDPGRCAYLFLAGPVLDLPAVLLIATGDSAGGLVMIVAMLPIGLLATVVTWRWITAEERQARARAAHP
ncbi:hypothetical protein [Streptomyces bluensis]|uniref:hypothetical protein n=1 Tax=Streptomyces bluensis TaxID=33897 RepID=UPI00332CC0C3